MYPSTSKFAHRGVGGGYGGLTPPERPTHWPPGTVEKLLVLAERAKEMVSLWHEFDARYEGDPRPVLWAAGLTETLT